MYFNSIADLIAQLTITSNEFIVGGFYKPGDGGGGTFIWYVPPIADPWPDEDLGIIFYSPNDSTGYFQRIFSGPVNVRWFGAIKGGIDPNPPVGYPSTINDVTPYVHRARDSKEFANNGTLYFPKGEYPGAFVFTYVNADRDEFNLIGDGLGTVLTMANGAGTAVLTLGHRTLNWAWRWAKVSNLKIDGRNKSANGVKYENAGTSAIAGRWVFEQVFFTNCDSAVYKPYGNIGNHYIDCTWQKNNIGVYAVGDPGVMHNGCDRYSGGSFKDHTSDAVHYEDFNGAGGQIIFDGVVIEFNTGWGINIICTQGARFLHCAISIRNVYFENNNYENGGGDVRFEGVRSVRIDDSAILKIALIGSSVNLYNCAHVGGGARTQVDSKSSLVAYEHRSLLGVGEHLFVNSISYDAAPELGDWQNGGTPAPWIPTSVWGPLRAVTSTRKNIVVSEHFDSSGESWDEYGTLNNLFNSYTAPPRVLGSGSNKIDMTENMHVWSRFVIGTIPRGKYCVWSIHTYIEGPVPSTEEFSGEIVSEGFGTRLGNVYFKADQWVCSYGMKYVSDEATMHLAFKTVNFAASFYITDYQIVVFDDLASANSFVNSREYAIHHPGPSGG